MAATAPQSGANRLPLVRSVLDTAATAQNGLSHKFGIAQDEHVVEIVSPLQLHAGGPGWHLSDGSHVTGPRGVVSAYEVSVYLIPTMAVLQGSRSAGLSCHRAGALNFSDAQIKRSHHAG
jgi:hypothetical protein